MASNLSCAPLDPAAARITAVERAAMRRAYSSAIDSDFLNTLGTRPPKEQDPLPRLLWGMDEAQHTLVSEQNIPQELRDATGNHKQGPGEAAAF
jgi:hypothetical protein